jgi:Ca2+/Na+ antiporter
MEKFYQKARLSRSILKGMLTALVSLFFLLLFAEIASANFKRLAPVLEAWENSRSASRQAPTGPGQMPWAGGWEKLAALFWALGASIPLLAFATASNIFLRGSDVSGNLVMGATLGFNVVGLSLGFGLVLFSGPITFFRVRTVTSPVFLLIATVAFTYTCLNNRISWSEGSMLLLLILAYGLYFRRFSSEWKQFERAFGGQSVLGTSEGLLPVLALLCMGVGFFLLAVIVAYPFVMHLDALIGKQVEDGFRIGSHLVALAVCFPWLMRCLFSVKDGASSKAMTISAISHSCLLNVLLVPALVSFLGASNLAPSMLAVHLPVLLLFTGIFVAALLVEKEKGGRLPWLLLIFYLAYTGLGLLY